MSETTELEDAVDLSQHWTGFDPTRPEDLGTTETLLGRATRASRTLLDHAESGRWRDLLATYAPEPQSIAALSPTPPEPGRRGNGMLRPRVKFNRRKMLYRMPYSPAFVCEPFGHGQTIRIEGVFDAFAAELAISEGEIALAQARQAQFAGLCAALLHTWGQPAIPTQAVTASSFAAWCDQSFSLSRSAAARQCTVESILIGELAALVDRRANPFRALDVAPTHSRHLRGFGLSGAIFEAVHLAASAGYRVDPRLENSWRDPAALWRHFDELRPIVVSDLMPPILPWLSRPPAEGVGDLVTPTQHEASGINPRERLQRLLDAVIAVGAEHELTGHAMITSSREARPPPRSRAASQHI